MTRLDPRARKRSDVVSARVILSSTLTNTELLMHFERSLRGKLAQHTIDQYMGYLQDLVLYVRVEDHEVPFSAWSKSTVWEYVHYAQANYCRYFTNCGFQRAAGVYCTKRVWTGAREATEAAKTCAGCTMFESSRIGVQRRLEALSKLFQYLSRVEVVGANFVRDILREYRQDYRDEGRRERRRNPSVEEMRRLVNGTTHPMHRAFYATSAKWWFRPNEMLLLDRFASFPNFAQGGDLVIILEGKGVLDKRKGNRASVIDGELRPILEAYFAWWDRAVKRDASGRPLTTRLWINHRGQPTSYDSLTLMFYADCERLDLMHPGDRQDPLRRWSGHCQRHFGEKVLAMIDCPETWRKHFRGDVVKDAMGQYFVPTPEQIREKYHQWVPHFGFSPVPLAG